MADYAGSAGRHMLIGVIADEEICSGFLLAGIGESSNDQRNYLAVDDTSSDEEITEFYKELYNRPDIVIILISSNVARRIRSAMHDRSNVLPIVIEIPNKYEIAESSLTNLF